MVQVFAARQVCEKYLSSGKDVFWAFMDLEMATDTIGPHGMCQSMYSVWSWRKIVESSLELLCR